jgi:archaellum component FlaC
VARSKTFKSKVKKSILRESLVNNELQSIGEEGENCGQGCHCQDIKENFHVEIEKLKEEIRTLHTEVRRLNNIRDTVQEYLNQEGSMENNAVKKEVLKFLKNSEGET